LALVTLLLSLWGNIILRKKNKALSQKNKEIILARLKGQNTERKRMAGELHDNLNTKIAAVRWQLEAFQETTSPDRKEFISKLILQLNDVYEDVRLISHNLMPETVETIGLIQAINDLVTKLNESDRVNFNLVTDLQMDENFNALSYPVYNIIFEMINNVLKHSEATNAWISISRNQLGDLKLSVSDDGKGFDVDQMKNGYGIKSITSRIENLNGQWSIESTPGNGTKIYVEVPNL
jgi:signal transduction histidine kinase